MYKVIVVGTDGSERAGVAVKEAMAWAKLYGATLHAVNAVRSSANPEVAGSPQSQAQGSSERGEKDTVWAQLRCRCPGGRRLAGAPHPQR